MSLPVPAALVAFKVMLYVPADGNVPEMSPLGLIVSPAGSGVAPKLVGLLVAVIW